MISQPETGFAKMVEYEISIPGAARMIAQERLSQTERNLERIDPCAYGSTPGAIAQDVSHFVWRQYWCEAGGQNAVDHIRALLQQRGNNPAWQLTALQECIEQIREGRTPRLAYYQLKDEEYDRDNGIVARFRVYNTEHKA